MFRMQFNTPSPFSKTVEVIGLLFPTRAYDLTNHGLLSRFTAPSTNSLLWNGLRCSPSDLYYSILKTYFVI